MITSGNGPTLRMEIDLARAEERRPVVVFENGWATCPGCDQSCTGSYSGRQACTRCQRVVT